MGETVHTTPTIGSNVEEVIWRKIHFIMWDIGGQESLRASWSSYYMNTHFVIVVIDSTDCDRLNVIKRQLYSMLSDDDLAKAAILVFANKQDVNGAMSAAQISNELNLTSIKTHRWQIQPCCALTGEGLDKGLQWIASNIR
ncbi:hypothetical protein AB6A40_002021 [Gnathostoma spinigerum]|uniref:ADP-ribosylation factor-like protein 5B n=1 Tax=Gnathostoma spinigerum TaxID=75299 RepID=A0ABD6E7Q4_9BILA